MRPSRGGDVRLDTRRFAGLLRAFLDFARHSKAWWIVPLVILFLLLALLLFAIQGALSYLYTVF